MSPAVFGGKEGWGSGSGSAIVVDGKWRHTNDHGLPTIQRTRIADGGVVGGLARGRETVHALDPPAAAAELPLALGMGFGGVGLLGHAAAGYRQREEQQEMEAPKHLRWWG